MSPKNEYVWTPVRAEEFQKSKDILLSTKMVQPFNPSWITAVLSDASRLNDIEFALLKFDPKVDKSKRRYSLIQCGSSSLTLAQGNYATIELECLAFKYTVSKSEFYL